MQPVYSMAPANKAGWLVLVSLFNCLWTFVGYSMSNPYLEKNSSGTIYPIAWENKGVHAFPKHISLKVNIITWVDFKFAYYNVIVQQISCYAMRAPLHYFILQFFCQKYFDFWFPASWSSSWCWNQANCRMVNYLIYWKHFMGSLQFTTHHCNGGKKTTLNWQIKFLLETQEGLYIYTEQAWKQNSKEALKMLEDQRWSHSNENFLFSIIENFMKNENYKKLCRFQQCWISKKPCMYLRMKLNLH